MNARKLVKYAVVLLSILICPGLASAQSPIITADATVCTNATLQLQASPGISYQWTPAAGLNDATIQNPIFTAGSSNTTTTYTLTSVALGANLITNGDFEQGNTGFYTDYLYCNTSNCLFPLANNGYSVQSDPTFVHAYFTGADHTTGTGKFMIVNGAIPSYIAWQQTIPVKPNTDYVFAAWICSMYPQSPAVLNFTINGTPTSNNFVAPATTNQWVQYYIKWNSGSSTSAIISLNDINPASSGNDFGLDDIFFGEPVTQTGTVTVKTSDGIASVNIQASVNPDNICSGENVVFTATPTNGGTAPVYQWMVNGSNVGLNSPSFSGTGFTSADIVSCSMTSNAPCITGPVTSNSIHTIVSPVLAPSVSIATPATAICAGAPVTFTATAASAGATPAYQWLLNGTNAGTNSPTFNSNTFANGDIVSCVITANSPCTTTPTATSNSITLSVALQFTPSVSISASASSICAGTPVTFTATPGNGIPNPAYQWLINGKNAGANSTTFSTNTLANGDVISCVLSVSASCATTPTATSNSVAMVVNPNLTPSVSIVASLDNICSTTPVTFTATAVDAGTAPVYQWLLNGNNVGGNSPTYVNSNLANGDKISCTLTVNAPCTSPVVSVSNTIPITVTFLVTPSVSISASASSVCVGSPLTFTATPVNGGGEPVYQWMVNGNSAGENSPIFISSTLNNSDVITCNVANNAACALFINSKSNSITIKVNALPVVDAGADKTINKGGSTTLNATAAGNIAAINWTPPDGLDNNKILNPKASPTSSTLYTLAVQTTDGCVAVDSVRVTVLVNVVIPNTFTPNGDGVNDLWQIKNLAAYQNCFVRVFDRYGREVYTSRGYYSPWDGTNNGQHLPFGTYYYVIDLNDGKKPLSGFVAIIK